MELVTIIVPVYNTSKYLNKCLDTLLAQTYENIEIILVDDGSTDNSLEICKSYEEKDKRIVVISKANGGSSSARNVGLDAANGSFVGFVDSDDYVDGDFVSLMMEAIEKYDVPMAQISRDEINEDGTKKDDICTPPKEDYMISSKEQLRELLLHRGDCSYCTRITRKDLFDGLRFPEGKLNEDFYLMINMLPRIEKFIILPSQGYHVFYRLGSNSRAEDARNNFSRVFTDCVENADYVMKVVEESYPDLKKEALRFNLFQRLEYLLHIPIRQMTKSDNYYLSVVKYVRKHYFSQMLNPYLTFKNKIYLCLLGAAPRTVRVVHARLKGWDY